jgi:hypothetical protein
VAFYKCVLHLDLRRYSRGTRGAAAEARSTWHLEKGASFEIRSTWSFEKGEEVFISYGHETNAELLTSYGFFPAGSRRSRECLEGLEGREGIEGLEGLEVL